MRMLGQASGTSMRANRCHGVRPQQAAASRTSPGIASNPRWIGWTTKGTFAMAEASRVMHEIDPATYPEVGSWSASAKGRADVSAGLLAQRAITLLERRRPGHALMFVIDEVGQFVARDVQKMLDLQAIVQQLGVHGRGRMWLVVTSQERLGELVSGLDDKRVEHAFFVAATACLEIANGGSTRARGDIARALAHAERFGMVHDQITCRRLVAGVLGREALGRRCDEEARAIEARFREGVRLDDTGRARAGSASTACGTGSGSASPTSAAWRG